MAIEEVIQKVKDGWVLCIAKDRTRNASYVMNMKKGNGTFLHSVQIDEIMKIIFGSEDKFYKDESADEKILEVYDVYKGVVQ